MSAEVTHLHMHNFLNLLIFLEIHFENLLSYLFCFYNDTFLPLHFVRSDSVQLLKYLLEIMQFIYKYIKFSLQHFLCA